MPSNAANSNANAAAAVVYDQLPPLNGGAANGSSNNVNGGSVFSVASNNSNANEVNVDGKDDVNMINAPEFESCREGETLVGDVDACFF